LLRQPFSLSFHTPGRKPSRARQPNAKTAKGTFPCGKILFGCLHSQYCSAALYLSSDTACASQFESVAPVAEALNSLSGKLHGWPYPGILLKLLLFPLVPFCA
jgi:hypothetical protein